MAGGTAQPGPGQGVRRALCLLRQKLLQAAPLHLRSSFSLDVLGNLGKVSSPFWTPVFPICKTGCGISPAFFPVFTAAGARKALEWYQ